MDNEMIERVSKAMCIADIPGIDVDAEYGFNSASEFVPGGEGGETKPHAWMWYEKQAKAAIGAMREPTEAMLESSVRSDVFPTGGRKKHKRNYQAMIDAALKESE